MNLAQLAKKAARLPDISFDWAGPEQWHDSVFAAEVRTLDDAIKYIAALKDRMAAQSRALHELADAYRKLTDVILEAEVE